uniref:Uncharacterized protein n=1 Tax=Pectobacterium carotovorum TaxID=554 RepID=A0A0N9NRJ9_PECCA|nr:Hypothetical protein [Pectobacterium carotovorum]
MASLEERLFQFKVMRTFEIINFLIAIVSMSVWGRASLSHHLNILIIFPCCVRQARWLFSFV